MNFEENTFDFMNNVLKEIALLFPLNYVHIGGYEVWQNQKKQ